MAETFAPIGKPVDRVDGRLKVTGAARYAVEFPVNKPVHAVLVRSSIARGKITALDTAAAEKAAGVIGVFSHLHPLPWRDTSVFGKEENERGSSAMSIRPLAGEEIFYNGQYIAAVVAETLEQARHAAGLIRASYNVAAPRELLRAGASSADRLPVVLGKELDNAEVPKEVRNEPPERKKGDAGSALSTAEVKLDVTYTTPWETHNPMEPHATMAVWEGEKLTVYDATQNVIGVRIMLAQAFEIPAENVRVICKFTGGGFGSKGLAWPHVSLAAALARAVQRPVKVATHRHDMFTNVGYRSPTIQRIQLGAGSDGRLISIIHTGFSQSALRDAYAEPFTSPTSSMYAAPNITLGQKIVRLNVCRPTYMRAPGEVSGMYALECAMDELAEKLKLDPLELRLRNYAETDPLKGHPFSSKSLKQCYALAAEKFGWAARKPEPRSMRNGHMLIGYGMATSIYPVNRSEATAKLTLFADGTALAQSATHDLGTGTYTALAQLLADLLGLPVDKARFDLGDSAFPQAPVSGGSQSISSVGAVIKAAVDAARGKLLQMAQLGNSSPLRDAKEAEVTLADGRLFLAADAGRGEDIQSILTRNGQEKLEVIGNSKPGAEKKQFSMHAFGAHFCEVHVDAMLGTARVVRWTAAHACGRILNEKTARSQILGGIIMGIGMALMEETHIDERWGRVITDDLADYHVPVHADIPVFDSYFVPEIESHANPIGTKGIGEIGIVGAAAAIANAIYHATGKRMRDLPITPGKLLL